MTRAIIIVMLGVLGVTACDSGPRPDPVVVYATAIDETAMLELLARFTGETGIPVTAKFEDSATNTDNVINNEGSPPADILLTTNVADIWRAADQGALRPIQAATLSAVPAMLRDPDALWAAVHVRDTVIGVARSVDIARVGNYGDLADPEFSGEVCLSSSALSVNRSLIAMLVEDNGIKLAERVVRGWIRNLAVAPFASELELVDALRSGICHYGFFSSSVNSEGVSRKMSVPSYFDVDGIGVARHAPNAELAQAFVDWLLAEKSLAQPVSPGSKNVGLAGWRDEDARLLAERAAYP